MIRMSITGHKTCPVSAEIIYIISGFCSTGRMLIRNYYNGTSEERPKIDSLSGSIDKAWESAMAAFGYNYNNILSAFLWQSREEIPPPSWEH